MVSDGGNSNADLAIAVARAKTLDPKTNAELYASDGRYTLVFAIFAVFIFAVLLSFIEPVFLWAAIPAAVILVFVVLRQIQRQLKRKKMMDEVAKK